SPVKSSAMRERYARPTRVPGRGLSSALKVQPNPQSSPVIRVKPSTFWGVSPSAGQICGDAPTEGANKVHTLPRSIALVILTLAYRADIPAPRDSQSFTLIPTAGSRFTVRMEEVTAAELKCAGAASSASAPSPANALPSPRGLFS